MRQLVVRILICGLCAIEQSTRIYRTSDSEQGRIWMKRHVIEDHKVRLES